MMSLEAMLLEIRTLPVDDRKRLISLIVDTLTEPPSEKQRNIMEFRGVGKEMWAGVDAQEYVNRLRDEWDQRP